MPRTRWHTQIWPTPRVARGKARNDKANREQLALKSGGQGRNRTTDTRIFSPLLYRLSYLAIGVLLRCRKGAPGRAIGNQCLSNGTGGALIIRGFRGTPKLGPGRFGRCLQRTCFDSHSADRALSISCAVCLAPATLALLARTCSNCAVASASASAS